MRDQRVSPAPNADGALERVETVQEPFEDQSSDVDCLLAAWLQTDNRSAARIVHVAHPTNGSTDLFKVEHRTVDLVGLPKDQTISNGNQVGSCRAKHNNAATLIR